MKPIAIFQHTEVGQPGSVIPILESLGKTCRVIRIVDGEPVPQDVREFGGLVFMGGYMSANDDLPWVEQELALIRQADALDIPVAGHCLGSQLLARALGAQVKRNHRYEIGWQSITLEDGTLSKEWWGQEAGTSLVTFQWHGDTFDLPPGAQRIATSAACANQAFVIRGLHLGMQSHFEMTPELVALSLERNGGLLEREHAKGNPSVTSMEETRRDVAARTEAMRKVLTVLYGKWVGGCV